MKNIVLRELNINDEKAFLKGLQEWENEGLSWYTFIWKPEMSFQEHLKKLEEYKDQKNLPSHFAPNTMYYAFLENQIIGRFNLRHQLNENLLQRGGHIGYAVSPLHRRQGFALEILRQGLDHARHLNHKKVLITCSDDNVPSWKIIEKLQGQLEYKILDPQENELIRRYWIDLA